MQEQRYQKITLFLFGISAESYGYAFIDVSLRVPAFAAVSQAKKTGIVTVIYFRAPNAPLVTVGFNAAFF